MFEQTRFKASLKNTIDILRSITTKFKERVSFVTAERELNLFYVFMFDFKILLDLKVQPLLWKIGGLKIKITSSRFPFSYHSHPERLTWFSPSKQQWHRMKRSRTEVDEKWYLVVSVMAPIGLVFVIETSHVHDI